MTDATLDQARQSIAVGSKSFAMASRFLPQGMHEDCVMLYAWCRHADDVIDGQDAGFATGAVGDPAARLAELRELTHRALRGDAAAPVYAGLARVVAARQDIAQVMQALKLYRLDNSRYPTTEQGLQALAAKPTSGPIPNNWKSYLDKVPNDPWGRPYQYLNPGVRSEIDVFSFGADGQSGGTGVEADIGSWDL